MDPIIKVKALSKQYQLGGPSAAYSTLRETIVDIAKMPFRSFRRNGKQETIWALRDVSFAVAPGDVVGIIGRNGAGKSTLLKVLSRITEPTTGRVELYGRVASLLEVGTGFHPELTGRENIFLNGSILGMTRKEIELKFDEIVAFAEIEKFIDTPVKRFSSGMYVRLAFAVAAHLEPEILVVDEVLAVGDAGFQKKCLGRMRDVASEGRTVLFVSHNMAAVSALCSKAMVLWQGEVQYPLGDVHAAVENYLSQVSDIAKTNLTARTDRQGIGEIRIVDFGSFDSKGNELEYLSTGQEIDFRIYYSSNVDKSENVTVAVGITSQVGAFVSMLSNELSGNSFQTDCKEGYFVCKIRKLPLAPGNYTVNLIIRSNETIQDWIQEAVTLVVEPGDFYGTGRMPPQSHSGILIEQEWSVN
ncbi:MAG TPA: ABC transporter ATP-binding protein [Pyrinomonadaceae bacterium]|jgi:lipopolysaccharide transport system ATP-binding protein|nr:ABC transporter ATP-binding protein [Pyrinomonadaceae bacterium]